MKRSCGDTASTRTETRFGSGSPVGAAELRDLALQRFDAHHLVTVVRDRRYGNISAGLSEHRDNARVNDFRRLFANDMYAKQPHVFAPKEQL